MTMFASRTLSVSIAVHPTQVYAFVSDPRNLPQWAKGFCHAVRREEGGWIVETPQGPVKLRFAEQNTCGVLDHYVTPPTGEEIYVPMRVLPNGTGSEVLFTLFHPPDMSEEAFKEDVAVVGRDLRILKMVLEKGEQG
jgi:hypothetical protein